MLYNDITHTFLYDFTIAFSRLFYLYYTLSLLLRVLSKFFKRIWMNECMIRSKKKFSSRTVWGRAVLSVQSYSLSTWMAWCVRCVSWLLIGSTFVSALACCADDIALFAPTARAVRHVREEYDTIFFTSVMFNAAKSVWLFVTKSKQSYEYVSRFFVGGKSMVTEYIH